MTDFLMLAFVFLIAGVVAVPIASRLGLGSVLGYLIAGIVISPILALLGVDVISIQHFAEFGVVMMLFLVGLELEPKHLWGMRHQLLGLGGGQIALTTLGVMFVALAFCQVWTVALAIGLVLALSSTAIVAMPEDSGRSTKTRSTFTPLPCRLSIRDCPNTSPPTRPTMWVCAPRRAPATAWFAPLPPGTVTND